MQSTNSPITEALGNFSEGFAKSGLNTLQNIGNVVAKPVNAVLNKALGQNQTVGLAPETLKPQGTAQNIGAGTEQVAEFFAPAAAAAKAEGFVNLLSKGITSPALASASRITGKGLVQGISAGAVKLAQTGDPKAALETGLLAGGTRGAFATIGEGARALKLPERLYSTIFKNTASDMMQELKTENLVNLSKTNPEKYAQFVQQGIVSDSPTGPILNETVAKQALDSGLRGGIRHMARTVINGALDSENDVQNAVTSYKDTVDLSEKQFSNILGKISQDYQDVGFNEISDEAGRLAKTITDTGGKVDASTALAVRRLLDRARIASSFDKPASSLSMTQSNLKTLADTVRSRVNAIPGLGDIMSKYSFYIEAMDALAKEAARRGNNQALSLIDSLFLSSAFGGNNMIPGVTAGIARKVLMSGPGITHLGQFLNKGVASPATIGTISTAASGLQNLSEPQQ